MWEESTTTPEGGQQYSRNTQCGSYVNDELGLSKDEWMGDMYEDKINGKNFRLGGEPKAGDYFVMKTKSDYGHTGIVREITDEGIWIEDRNRKGKGKIRRTLLPYKSPVFKTITGYGNK